MVQLSYSVPTAFQPTNTTMTHPIKKKKIRLMNYTTPQKTTIIPKYTTLAHPCLLVATILMAIIQRQSGKVCDSEFNHPQQWEYLWQLPYRLYHPWQATYYQLRNEKSRHSPEFCADSMHSLTTHCDKCLNFQGDYTTKQDTVLFSHEESYFE